MAKAHSTEFIHNLSGNQRNALHVLLSSDAGTRGLRMALGVKHTVTEEEHRMGLARRGRTVELFTGYRELSPADMKETL